MRRKTPEQNRRAAAECLAKGGTLREAADAAGVSLGAVANWKKKDPEFARWVEEYTPAPLVILPDVGAELPKHWRNNAATSMAHLARGAVEVIAKGLDGDATKVQVDCAWKILDALEVGAPEEVAESEIYDAEDMVEQLATFDRRLLIAALQRVETA